MTAIEIRGLTKRFGNVTALDGFDLEVEKGKFAVVLGASGSGKTTLLRLIAGLESVDSGEIRLSGESVENMDPRQRDIAMVFQQDGLLPHLTVAENLQFPLRMQSMGSRKVRQQAAETAELLGIASLMTRRPDELSGGQRQRVALGRALVRRPRVFLLDEPLGQLDTPLRAALRDELRRLQRKLQVTTLLVTHDQGEAMELADQLVILDQHRCVQQGTPLEVYDRPATPDVAAFLGSPPMNFLACRWERKGKGKGEGGGEGRGEGRGAKCTLAGVTFELPESAVRPGASTELPAMVGIRPEHLALEADALDLCWTAHVDEVIQLGFDSVVDLQLSDGQSRVKLRVAGRAPVQAGESVVVGARWDDLRWF